MPTLGDAEISAATDVLRSGRTTMGTQVEHFEQAFAKRVKARHAIMVNSGSSADLLVAFAIVTHAGRVATVPAVTWPTQVWSLYQAGYTVELVDVDPHTLAADYSHATKNVAVAGVVHLMGNRTPMAGAMSADVVLEDCCECTPSPLFGRRGFAATWSFFFSHHMTTMEGGMVTTNDDLLADRLRSMRSHGWARHRPGADPYEFVEWGFNVRPTEVAAAIGLVQLGRLDEMNRARRLNYDAFAHDIRGVDGIHLVHSDIDTVPFGLVMLVDDRDGLAGCLEALGVETRPILAGNIARQPVADKYGLKGDLPGADLVHDHGLYLGLHPFVELDRIERLVRNIRSYQERITP